MGALMGWTGALVALCTAPVILTGTVGFVLILMQLIEILRKAAEPPTVDTSGDYSLDQANEVQDR